MTTRESLSDWKEENCERDVALSSLYAFVTESSKKSVGKMKHNAYAYRREKMQLVLMIDTTKFKSMVSMRFLCEAGK